MGLKYAKRNRMESLPGYRVSDLTLAAIAETDLTFGDKYDFDIVANIINQQLTTAQNNFRAKNPA